MASAAAHAHFGADFSLGRQLIAGPELAAQDGLLQPPGGLRDKIGVGHGSVGVGSSSDRRTRPALLHRPAAATAIRPAPGFLRNTFDSDLMEHAKKHGLAKACRVLFNANEFVFID